MDYDTVLHEITSLKEQNSSNNQKLRKLKRIAKAHSALNRALGSLKPKTKPIKMDQG